MPLKASFFRLSSSVLALPCTRASTTTSARKYRFRAATTTLKAGRINTFKFAHFWMICRDSSLISSSYDWRGNVSFPNVVC